MPLDYLKQIHQLFVTAASTELNLPYKTSIITSNVSTDTIRHTNEVNDPSGVHNTTTGVYTVNDSGSYDVQISVKLNAEFKPTAAPDTTAECAILGNIILKNGSSILDVINVGITYTGTIGAGATGTTGSITNKSRP